MVEISSSTGYWLFPPSSFLCVCTWNIFYIMEQKEGNLFLPPDPPPPTFYPKENEREPSMGGIPIETNKTKQKDKRKKLIPAAGICSSYSLLYKTHRSNLTYLIKVKWCARLLFVHCALDFPCVYRRMFLTAKTLNSIVLYTYIVALI